MPNYHGGKDSLYEILEVHHGSTPKEVERAFRRLKEAAEKEAAPPEQLSLLRQAHEVLSDPQKRAAYDASLRRDEFLRPESRALPGAVKWGPIGLVAVALLVGLWFLFRPAGESDRIPAEIVAAAGPSVGRVSVIDIRGRATPFDNAFAVDSGVMLTSCQGFRANTQAVVKIGQRNASASVSRSDPKRNLCRLAVVSAGSWPLGINTTPPQPGDKVYAVSATSSGETNLMGMKVRGILPHEGTQYIELVDRLDPSQNGGPLLDLKGRVIGMLTTQHPLPGKNVALPASWLEELRRAPTK